MACGHKCIETAKDWWLLTISGWVYFFFSLFFWWPIIILKRRRNASGLGNKVASSIILSCRNTQKKKIPRKHCQHIQVSLLPSSCSLFCRLFSSVISNVGAFALNLIDDCTARAALCDDFDFMYSSSNDSFDLLSSNCRKCWSPIPGGYSLKSSPVGLAFANLILSLRFH